jgi:hypothetical protein
MEFKPIYYYPLGQIAINTLQWTIHIGVKSINDVLEKDKLKIN